MENNIAIKVPITIAYAALEGAARKKMEGEYISTKDGAGEETRHAQVHSLAIAPSQQPGYHLVIDLKLSVLRTLLKRDGVDLRVQAALGYDNERQLLFLSRYKVDARTSSSFYNGSLEVLANSVAQSQILKKARLDLRALISRELAKVNSMLEQGKEMKGIVLRGQVDSVQVQDITPQPEGVSLLLVMYGQVAAEVRDLEGLMPPV